MKLIHIVSILLTVSSAPAFPVGDKVKSKIEQIDSKYGWHLTFPSCWRTEGIDDEAPATSPEVNIWIDACPGFKEGKWTLKILSHANSILRTSKELYESESNIAIHNKTPVLDTNVQFNGKKTRVLKRLYPSGLSSWFMVFDCKYALSIMITGKVEAKTLQEVKLPAEIESVISKIACTKPKKG